MRGLLRHRDGIYGCAFSEHIATFGIGQVLSAPRSPWQRAYVERVIGTIRRECLDDVVVFCAPCSDIYKASLPITSGKRLLNRCR